MLDDLNDLFGAVDFGSLAEDMMDYGSMAFIAVGANVAYTTGTNWALNKFWPTAPAWMKKYVVPGVAILGGAAGGAYLNGKGYRRFGSGIGVGLASAGLMMLVRSHLPADSQFQLAGGDLAGPEDEALLGLGEDLYDKYLGSTTLEVERGGGGVNGLSSTTLEVERGQGVSGLANFPGMRRGVGGVPVAATFS